MGASYSGKVYLLTINHSCKFFDVYPPFRPIPFIKGLIDEAPGRTYNKLIVIINKEARNG
jgi:hypothetical protein